MPDSVELDKRVLILETKDTFIMEALRDNKTEHRQIMDTLKIQSNTLQEMKNATNTMSTSVKDVHTRLNLLSEKQTTEEKKSAGDSVKVKVLWGIFTAIAIGCAGVLVKVVSGCG